MSELLVTTVKHESATTDNITLASNGNVGIGTSPAHKLDISGTAYGGVYVKSTSTNFSGMLIENTNSATKWQVGVEGGTYIGAGTFNIGISAVGSKLAIDPSGNVMVNTVSAIAGGSGVLQVKGNPSYNAMQLQVGTNGNNGILFFNATAGAVGSIVVNSSSVAYNTSSDYRLKEDWVAVADASTRVNALKPVNFAWKADGSRVDGFLAHELAEVVPEAVSGEKDAMRDEEYEVTPAVLDDEGAVVTPAVMGTRSVPDYQGIDQSKLVPLLTAALQEALAKIEDLTARVSALETA